MHPEMDQYLTRERLDEILDRLPSLHIAVLGDFFLDKYLIIDPSLAERSIETGLEARQVIEVRCSPGAAGTVTNNLAALGIGQISAVGIVGMDGHGFELLRGLRESGVSTDLMLELNGRFTPTYTKSMIREAEVERETERTDIKNRTQTHQMPEHEMELCLRHLLGEAVPNHRSEFRHPHGVVLLDQVSEWSCGVITDGVRQRIADIAADYPAVHFLADSRAYIGEFRGVAIKPNIHEAACALGAGITEPISDEAAREIGSSLARRNGKPVYLTLGAGGILVCDESSATHVPAVPVDGPIDIVGAGDSTSAGIVSALCAGATPAEAAMIGNLCAAVTIRKLGTTGTASQAELRKCYAHNS